jgi:thiol-disulfide isomerase/thioredoxin
VHRASGAAWLIGGLLVLTGCAGQEMYAATPVVTIPAGTPSADVRVGLTIIPEAERGDVLVIAGETADRTPLSTADMTGDIVVVNAWASWCPPCIEELPLLAAAATDFADDGVTFLGLNSLDDPIAAAGLLASSTYPSIDDRDGAVLATIPGVPPRSLPSTVILDRQGRLAVRVIGPLQPGQLEETLTTLLAEGP